MEGTLSPLGNPLGGASGSYDGPDPVEEQDHCLGRGSTRDHTEHDSNLYQRRFR